MDSMSYNSESTEIAVTKTVAASKTVLRTCPECGIKHLATKKHARFCSREHRNSFNNRRMIRGLEIYDLLMACRYQRGLASKMKLWGLVCKILARYREEDQRERAGRASWLHPKLVVPRWNYLYAEILINPNYQCPARVSEDDPEV